MILNRAIKLTSLVALVVAVCGLAIFWKWQEVKGEDNYVSNRWDEYLSKCHPELSVFSEARTSGSPVSHDDFAKYRDAIEQVGNIQQLRKRKLQEFRAEFRGGVPRNAELVCDHDH